ncbi:hypothetical protein C0585_02560 [Candidatus Woesearchaeota archaeon]|nr:MAG: hypothetical protein C0585_02560 [Candidatus Woesearchaeota archaeon]
MDEKLDELISVTKDTLSSLLKSKYVDVGKVSDIYYQIDFRNYPFINNDEVNKLGKSHMFFIGSYVVEDSPNSLYYLTHFYNSLLKISSSRK